MTPQEQKLLPGDILKTEQGETVILLRTIDYGMLWRCSVTMHFGNKLGFKDTTIVPFSDDQIRKMTRIGSIKA